VQISPRYDADPIVRLDGPPGAIGVPFLRQRRRLARTLSSLSPAQWAAPSRCEGWRVQDVVAHLTGTDQFWLLSITSGLAGTPTRILAAFDPKATPAAMVDAVRDVSPEETLARYVDASTALCAAIEAFGDTDWDAVGESPVGHVTMTALAHHALWDSWIHERDVLAPLGIAQEEEPDEILASLRYAASLGPAFALQTSPGRAGALAITVTRPDGRLVVTSGGDVRVGEGDPPSGALVLTGGAVDLLEALSVRAPWPQAIPDDMAWLVMGLSAVFETAATPS
jgi:uncharacterized protein (TIGR03083 family)